MLGMLKFCHSIRIQPVTSRYNDFISYPPNENWAKLAPLRILSFDIECEIRGKAFPDASIDSVIQIANMVTRRGESTTIVEDDK
jgi:DNA polymerase delta subunit 1